MGLPSDFVRSRLLPALIAALGVSFVVAGLLTYTTGTPLELGATAEPTALASPVATETPALPSASDGSGSAEPSPSGSTSPEPSSFPTNSAVPSDSGMPTAPASVSPSAAAPSTTPAPSKRVATRVLIPALQIDLPIVRPPGSSSTYPLCNVAMFIQSLSQPGLPGATYLYAHAREGMFLPLLEASQVNNGKAMIGMLVEVFTSDDLYFLYQVTEVRRHQTTLSGAIAATDQELWLQTSEGPHGTPGKLQVIALPLSSGPASPTDAHPTPHPVVCG
jgi:hypothetical protein